MRVPLKLDSTTTELRDFRILNIVYFFFDRLKRSCSVVHNDNEPQCGLLKPLVLKTEAIEAIEAMNKFFLATYIADTIAPSMVESSYYNE